MAEWSNSMTQPLPESPIQGLVVKSVDNQDRYYYEPIFCKVLAASQYNPNQFSLAGLIGYWELDERIMRTLTGQTLNLGSWYKFALATKEKPASPRTNPGSMYQDIRQVRLATDDEIPEQPPAATGNSQQTGSQQPTGDFNTGMAFNKAVDIVAALIIQDPEVDAWSTDRIIACVKMIRERLYNEVLMQPIGTPDENPSTDWDEEPEPLPLADEEPPASNPF